jgi:hypothetical protein
MSVDGLPSVESIDANLADLARPYRELLAQIEADLATVQTAANLLRENRNKLRTALRAIDPTYDPESKPGPKGKRPPTTIASQGAADAAAELLSKFKDNGTLNGGPFTASDLARRDDWEWSQSYSGLILAALHERGIVRLDSIGGPTGNAKLYVLV